MNQTHPQIYRAEWVLPISGEPIENGEVIVECGRILETRKARSSAELTRDFGSAILMPGLVNVHTHLDYTVMRGILEDVEFSAWIRELNARKSALTPKDWVVSATWGAAEAIAGGVTALGDCTDSGAACAGALAFGMGGVIYQEVFGIDESQPVATIVQNLQEKVKRLQAQTAGTSLRIGISPHAPYTVRPELFHALKAYADRENLPVCIHAAESRAEAELLLRGAGPIAEMYQRRGIEWNPPGTSTVAYLDSFGILGPQTLLVHGAQVSASDRHLLADRNFGWAYCPKSNAKLGNGVAPLGLLGRKPPESESSLSKVQYLKSKIGLGSDSVASNNAMDLFEEMRFAVLMQRGARQKIGVLTAREAVIMATAGGAACLGLLDESGTLEPGKRADLCVVSLNALHTAPVYDPYNALVYSASASDVIFTLIGGEVKYDASPGPRPEQRFVNVDIAALREQMRDAARKMREWQA